MKSVLRGMAPLVVAGLLAACGSTGPEGPFTLVFAGDASFHAYAGGQQVQVAVVLEPQDTAAADSVVARDSSLVSALADPSFSFTFPSLLEAGSVYGVDYWLDVNGNHRCDAPPTDEAWRVALGRVTGAVSHMESYDPDTMADVCATFAPDSTG